MQEVRDDEDELEAATVYLLHIVGQIVQHIVQIRPLEILLLLVGRGGHIVDMPGVVDQVGNSLGANLTSAAHFVDGFTAKLDDGHIVPFLQGAEELSQSGHHGILVLVHGTGHIDGEDVVCPLAFQLLAEFFHQLGIIGLERIKTLRLRKDGSSNYGE